MLRNNPGLVLAAVLTPALAIGVNTAMFTVASALLLRTAVPPLSMTSAVREQISALDADQPVTGIETLDEIMDSSRSQPRFLALLLSIFSATTLALSVIGIYGVLAYNVTQRQREVGLRMALGVRRGDVLRRVVRQGLMLASTGVGIGLIAALWLTSLMSSMLYKVGARDLTTFGCWLERVLRSRRADLQLSVRSMRIASV